MNKFILFCLVCFLSPSAFAQGGSWYIGGEFGFNSSNTNTDLKPSSTSWSFGPEIGTFFNEKWSAGIVLKFAGDADKNKDGKISDSFAFTPDIYGRRWWKAGERLGIMAGLDVAFGTGTTTTYTGTTKFTLEQTMFGANLNTGVAYSMADRWTLLIKFAALGYTSVNTGGATTGKFDVGANTYLSNGQFVFIGLYYTFCKAKVE